jgi:adenylylsulfate kinase-like enzyme
MVIWILGLSGSGKSYLSTKLKDVLQNDQEKFLILDGDVIRNVFDNDLGFSIEDRNINASRISKLALFLNQNNINVIVSVLSLFPEWLKWNRSNIKEYYEIFIDVPVSILKNRNIRNVYFQDGIKNRDVVGVDIEFIKPRKPDLTIKNNFDDISLKKNLEAIKNLIKND